MTYKYFELYVVCTEKKAAFYGLRILINENDSDEDRLPVKDFMWLILEKQSFVAVDYLSQEEFEGKYAIVENSWTKLGGTVIYERCKEAADNFIEDVWRHCFMSSSDNIEDIKPADNIRAILNMYDSHIKKLLNKIKGKIINFKFCCDERYVLVEDLLLDTYPMDEKLYYPEIKVSGPQISIYRENQKTSFDFSERKTFLGYADEILLREKMKRPQNFEVIDNFSMASNEIPTKMEDTFKQFMDSFLYSELYYKLTNRKD